MDRAASAAGLSRSQWVVRALSQHLFDHEKNSLGPTTLQSVLTIQMMLEASLSSRIDASTMQKIRQVAKKMAGKYYDA